MIARDDDLPEIAPARPAWLMTLADLALLLVAFFVFMQANQLDGGTLARGIRAGFGGADTGADVPPAPMPVAASALDGFAPGSAEVPAPVAPLVGWATEALRDPRATLAVTGMVDGTTTDVDAATQSPALLAADRARSVASVLIAHGIDPRRIALTAAGHPGRRSVSVTTGFAGNRQSVAAPVAAPPAAHTRT
ncbi:OmpA family protein [Sphingomonas sp. CARO-RG-8B-R24-01]|uniref:OmpA family protein n=1 Tax=Sphingomonas sp. CARO-RG-8B-R24-01 TaxID=2914831 RepID=UPI001F571283|nr:OmpA family protein [Sphingomonas sp. CARO-RG-8B-R24-01]